MSWDFVSIRGKDAVESNNVVSSEKKNGLDSCTPIFTKFDPILYRNATIIAKTAPCSFVNALKGAR